MEKGGTTGDKNRTEIGAVDTDSKLLPGPSRLRRAGSATIRAWNYLTEEGGLAEIQTPEALPPSGGPTPGLDLGKFLIALQSPKSTEHLAPRDEG